jgi:hypothetical protein
MIQPEKPGMNGSAFQARLANNESEGDENRMILIARLKEKKSGLFHAKGLFLIFFFFLMLLGCHCSSR